MEKIFILHPLTLATVPGDTGDTGDPAIATVQTINLQQALLLPLGPVAVATLPPLEFPRGNHDRATEATRRVLHLPGDQNLLQVMINPPLRIQPFDVAANVVPIDPPKLSNSVE